jgi:hypothetical protein
MVNKDGCEACATAQQYFGLLFAKQPEGIGENLQERRTIGKIIMQSKMLNIILQRRIQNIPD